MSRKYKTIKLDEIKQLIYIFEGKLYYNITNKLVKESKITYTSLKINGNSYLYHRILYQLYYNLEEIPQGYFIDHIDSDKCNNKIDNLRLATNAQNQYNSKLSSRNTSGIKGVYVSKDKRRTCYSARIIMNKQTIGKKFPYTPEGLELAKVWLEETRKELHGEFARNE